MAHGLRSYRFRKERSAIWFELDRLVTRVEKRGPRGLSSDDLARLPLLYHATLSSLNVARSITLDRNTLDYLEALCARSYFAVYGVKRRFWETIFDFFLRRFPCAVRAHRGPMLLSTVTLLLGVLTAFVMVTRDMDWYYAFVDPVLSGGRDPTASTEFLREGLYDTGDAEAGDLAFFASLLFGNNARVAMLAACLGILAGVPAFLLVFSNGLMLGAFLALYADRGLGFELVGWLMPHGVTELLAIALAGGAGFLMAQAFLFPGRRTRLDSIAHLGRDAGAIVLGCVAMLVIAAGIEGVFRQVVHNDAVRYAVIVATAALWIAYFGWVGRRVP